MNSINPYRKSVGLLYHRLLWDWRPAAFRSRRRLAALTDMHRGEKAVILCNGPSLKAVQLDALKNVYTFGLNKINLLFDETGFKPSCVVSINPLVLEQNREFFSTTDIPLFLDSKAREMGIPDRETVAFLHNAYFPGFAEDCRWSIFQGFTVTYVALQLAFHCGFDEVALVGCDHFYGDTGTPNQVVERSGADNWHFDPHYFPAGSLWQTPDLAMSEVYYRLAQVHYQQAGRKLVNCTPDTHLDVLPRMDLPLFLAGTL